jgi:hypothetical protein
VSLFEQVEQSQHRLSGHLEVEDDHPAEDNMPSQMFKSDRPLDALKSCAEYVNAQIGNIAGKELKRH